VGGSDKMRFIGIAEFNLEDYDKAVSKNKELQEERRKYPDRYPRKILLENGETTEFFMGSAHKAFVLYEGTENQIANLGQRWIPEAKWKFIPIYKTPLIVK
jgi:hypothetical protein